MPIRTDDRWVADSMKRDPQYHAGMAKRFINKMGDKLKKPGITTKDRARIERKMKLYDKKRKKFLSGKGLEQRKYFN